MEKLTVYRFRTQFKAGDFPFLIFHVSYGVSALIDGRQFCGNLLDLFTGYIFQITRGNCAYSNQPGHQITFFF